MNGMASGGLKLQCIHIAMYSSIHYIQKWRHHSEIRLRDLDKDLVTGKKFLTAKIEKSTA